MMMNFRIPLAGLACILALLSIPGHSTTAAPVPRLVVLVSYDQYRGDYPSLFASKLGSKGFARFRAEGATFDSCLYEHANLLTGPGHATLLTGCYPHKTGIPANDYCHLATGHCYYCAEDTVHGLSPVQLQVPTFGDALKARYPDAKVAGIGIKDRAAILMAGKSANPVLWVDYSQRRFTSSSYYTSPAWLDKLNTRVAMEASAGKTWTSYVSSRPDDVPWEGTMSNGKRAFPYTIPAASDKNFIADYSRTPYCISDLFAAAEMLIDEEKLGADGTPDVLVLGVSPTDFVGHTFGPDSREVEELFIACDTILGNFIDHLDARFGRENYMVIVASDHGVAPIPEFLKNSDASADAGRIGGRTLRKNLDSALTQAFGAVAPASWVWQIEEPSLYFNDSLIAARSVNKDSVLAVATRTLKAIDGIREVVATAPLLQGRCPQGMAEDLCRRIRNSAYGDRIGQLLVYPRENWVFGSTPATHGTPYGYDRHIPLMMLGGGIEHTAVRKRVEPVDIAATLALWFGVDMPGIDGKVLPVMRGAGGR